jgi:hypothetical protein
MLHEYHVIYSIWYYLRFHVTVVGLGMYYPWTHGGTNVLHFYINSFVFNKKYLTISHPISIHYISEIGYVITICRNEV